MERDTFTQHLAEAVELAMSFAGEFVSNELPDRQLLHVYPNQSFDGHPLKEDEVLFPEDTDPEDAPLSFEKQEDAVAFLWREGKIPEWIDVSVESENGQQTFLSLLCCGRFTATDNLLYYKDRDTTPFAVKSPPFPPGYMDEDTPRRRYNLNWRRDRDNPGVERVSDD